MIRYIYILMVVTLSMLPLVGSAQQLFTSGVAPFEMREEAEQRSRKTQQFYRSFSPKPIFTTDSTITVRQLFILPENWSDRVVTLHAENIGAAYDLVINDKVVFSCEDSLTPTDVNITKYLSQGGNRIDMILRETKYPMLQGGAIINTVDRFEGSYLVAQPTLHIHDVDISLTPDETGKFAKLRVVVAMRNDFSRGESVDVGFDIYDPSGKLLEFSVNKIEVAANKTDSITFTPTIYGASENRWSTSSPALYKVMVYVRRGGVVTEYMPKSVGFIDIKYQDGKLYNFSEQIKLNPAGYMALGDRAQSRIELLALKAEGHNAISTYFPQPLWLYELCDELGLWVIDQVNINATQSPEDRKVGGTPSNDPSLVGEYLRRARSTYSRTRGFSSVVGYSLGGEKSGNGYNMYRLYEWFKGVESGRPIIYKGANGEWNSDIIE